MFAEDFDAVPAGIFRAVEHLVGGRDELSGAAAAIEYIATPNEAVRPPVADSTSQCADRPLSY